MNTPHPVTRAVRYALLTGAAVAGGGLISNASAANANNPAKLGKVTVTGSRIKRTSIETAQPTLHITRQQIQKSGFTNIGDFLARLSSTGGYLNSTVNNNLGNNAGETFVDLRSLGAGRTLILVDGKRWIPGLGGATNVNTIPTSIIERIDVLKDGASAIYGSDAIAGVVNIITRKNFKGAEAHAYYGIQNDSKTGHWDGQVKQYDFTVGDGNDRGNVVFNATYREQNPIRTANREISSVPIFGKPADIGGGQWTPKGRFTLFGRAVGSRSLGQGSCGAYNPDSPTATLCDLTLRNAPHPPSLQNFRNYTPKDSYNYQQTEYLQIPEKQVTTYVQGHYDLFDNVTFTANAAYIRTEDTTQLSPQVLEVGANSPFTDAGTPIGIAKSNPYNPFGKNLVADTSDPCIAAGTCIGLGTLSRLTIEDGFRIQDINRDSFHIFAGFNGYFNLLDREIDWDVGFAQNRVQNTTLGNGELNTANIAKALGPAAQCTSPCVPLNLFGGATAGGSGSITQDMLDYIAIETHNITQSNLRDWTANLAANDVIDLPAGPLGVAIGWERLDNYGYFHPDATIAAGEANTNKFTPTSGRVARDAEYAELNIPLLGDLPGIKSLSLDVANRWTQYKRAGGTSGNNVTSFVHNSSGRLNIKYQPISDLLLRASWSQAFRSPNVSELFGGTNDNFVNVSDPCAEGTFGAHTPGTPLPPNCPNGNVDVQSDAQIHGVNGANRNLKPEKAISRTVGFVYSPSQVPGLDVNADYFKIEINNTVSTVGFRSIVNGCFYNSTFCDLLTVKSNQITEIRNLDTNIGSLLTEGIDVGLHYKFPSTPFGDFDASINGTFLKAWDITEVNLNTATGFATSHLAGVTEQPRRRFNGRIDWDYGNWSAQYRIEYFDHVVANCDTSFNNLCTPGYRHDTTDYQGVPGQLPNGRNHLGATVYHDVNVAYTVPAINTTVALGVENLFDKKPPISTGTGTNYDSEIYRLPSRLIYGDITVKF
jgi:outer membrane receptor protein involved in Fe transport